MSISVGLVVLASLLLTPPPAARPRLATAGAAIALGSAAIYTGTALRLRRSRGRR
ncbi:hypothetical protein [Curtobacterium sp. 458]|uniref:hypothetical protein n=1 Tax=Curtobacterium sp. 458 TaxID=3050069 RepID=UPI0025B28845|nr:hypothetical protein [Curtobacterium sp. 458]WJY01642.1 hypothetical protein QPJ90_08055 [Curtobacterium sp. 458]